MANAFDMMLFEAAHGLVASSAPVFYDALTLSDMAAWTVGAVALVGMWFAGTADHETPDPGRPLRLHARSRVVLLFGALVASFVAARVVAHVVHRVRPLGEILVTAPIPPEEWARIKGALKLQGAFPSDHAAMFAVLVVGLFALDRRLGAAGLAVAMAFAAMRVGVGFHWPTDILAGAAIGTAAALGALALRHRLAPWLEPALLGLERHAAWCYPVLFLIMLDFTAKFSGLFSLLAALTGRQVEH